MKRNDKGFTIAELLIVIAIIAVLISISIPVFHSQLEKSRQAVDLSNARNIEAVLATSVNDGTIEFTSSQVEGAAWVYVSRDSVKFYIGHSSHNDKNADVKVNGSTEDSALAQLFVNAGLISKDSLSGSTSVKNNLFVRSRDDISGWNWYKVYVCREADGKYRTGVISGVGNGSTISGADPANPDNKGKADSASRYDDGTSNMAKLFSRQ